MRTSVKFFSSLLLLLSFSMLTSCSGKTAVNLVITPKAHDFGTLQINTTAEIVFDLTNKSSGRITIVEIKLIGADASEFGIIDGQAPPNIYIESKQIHKVTVQFKPTKAGALEAELYVKTVIWSTKIKLDGTGLSEPIIEVTPTSFDFGSITNNTTVTQNFTVENSGVLDLILTAPSITGTDENQFAITAGASGVTVTPGNTTIITVAFTPTSDGVKTAALEIPHNASSANPHIIDLTGTGTMLVPLIDITPPTHDFGSVGVGASKVFNFSVENTGGSDLFVTDVNFIGANSADFSCLTTLSLKVSAGTTENLSIRFMPLDIGNRGPVTASVENNAGAPFALTLSGEGIVAYTITTNGYVTAGLNNSTNIFQPGLSHDNASAQIPIGFTFNYFGNDYTEVYVSTNGFITFTDNSADSNSPTALPAATAPNNLIALFWDDLEVDMTGNSNDMVHYLLEGTGPNRTLTIEYFSVTTSSGGFVYGKIKLYETTNVFELLYTDPADWVPNYFAGVSCAIGCENIDGTVGFDTSAGTSPNISTAPTQSYIFTPN